MLKIKGLTIIEHIINRLSNSKKIDEIYILTSTNKADDKIAKLAKIKKFNIFRGSEQDVLSRFYFAAQSLNID